MIDFLYLLMILNKIKIILNQLLGFYLKTIRDIIVILIIITICTTIAFQALGLDIIQIIEYNKNIQNENIVNPYNNINIGIVISTFTTISTTIIITYINYKKDKNSHKNSRIIDLNEKIYRPVYSILNDYKIDYKNGFAIEIIEKNDFIPLYCPTIFIAFYKRIKKRVDKTKFAINKLSSDIVDFSGKYEKYSFIFNGQDINMINFIKDYKKATLNINFNTYFGVFDENDKLLSYINKNIKDHIIDSYSEKFEKQIINLQMSIKRNSNLIKIYRDIWKLHIRYIIINFDIYIE